VEIYPINIPSFTEFVQMNFVEHASATARVLEGNQDSIHTAINATVSHTIFTQVIS